MKTINTINKRFLTNTDNTGRFIVKSLVTGKVYYVEAIGKTNRSNWGDVDVCTKKLRGNYGHKYAGFVNESQSLITKENGFNNITYVKGSPFAEIERRDRLIG